MRTWKCTHLYVGDDEISRVNPNYTVTLPETSFAPPAPFMFVAPSQNATGLVFVELPEGWHGDWHPSPKVQWVICLAGLMGYQAGDGATFTLQAGSFILTSDTQGLGHKSWNAGTEPIRLALLQI